MPRNLPQLYSRVAGTLGIHDFIELLEALEDDVADVRTTLEPSDTVETRQTLAKYLAGAVDVLRRKVDNSRSRPIAPKRDDT